ncbi:uncharacterized protein [Temnothorax longispinosus]|uniref:uncharacterized protein n=1 Tax=Temnothorax longispinosus TaxID=300112 RepID=UPI003A9A625D
MMENGSFVSTRSPEDTIKQFEAYLRKYENDDKLVILEAAERPGSKPGDNYMSIMIRTKVVGTRGDGSPYAKTFMTKKIQESNISTLMDLSDLFRMEAHAYTKVLPILGPFGPRCVHADQNTIIMEDLAEKGYVTCERRNLFDLDHTVFALKKLAKLHASALALKINDPRKFDTLNLNIEEIIYKDNSQTSEMRKCTELCVKSIVEYLDKIQPQTQELQTIRNYFTTCIDKTYDAMRRIFTAPKKKYDTICHGDPWVNNLLFLYDNDGRIIDLKMVDYQIIRYTSIATDILYFIYSSVRSSLIERSFESFIKIYHKEFLNALQQSGVTDEKILAELRMEWLESELRTYSFYGLLIGCFLINPILAEEEDVRKFQTIELGVMNPVYQADTSSPMGQKKIDRVKCMALHYYKRFHLGIINDDIEPITDTIKQFEAYLRRYENDDKLVILEAVERPGSNLGDNYTSMLIRTKVFGTRGDGNPYTKTFMTKMTKRGSNISALMDLSDLFLMEAHAYTKVLPILGSFGPQCVYADKDTIIMEDLAEKGYVTCERRNLLDLDHTVFALKTLARLHASALALKINNPRQFDTLNLHLQEVIYKDDSSKTSVMRWITELALKSIVQYLDVIQPQTQELQTIKNHFATYLDRTYDEIRRIFTAPKQKYDTICHGDPWVNNLLFLHDNDGRIVDLKMVDYQIIRYTSIATDILYFIYSSVRSSLIERSFESLIKIYHNEFLNELRRLDVNEKILAELGMEWLESVLRTYSFYGMISGCMLINTILAEEEDVQKFETMDFDVMNQTYQAETSSASTPKKINRVKCIAFHYYKRFHLGIINDDIEPISITDTVKQFEAYLKKYENDDKLVILEAVERPGSNLGDNYTSTLIRTKLVGTRGDGSPYAKTFMTKMIPDGKFSTLIDLSALSRMEAHTYTKVLPILGSFGPQCVYADKDTIIMEDLAEKGYVNCERRHLLDLDHTVFALKTLARLHASALSLKINNPRQFDTLNLHLEEVIYKDNSETSLIRSCTETRSKSIIQCLDMIEPRTQELQTIRDHIATYLDKTYDAMRRMFTTPRQKYDTICHGDPWVNNLLFLHDNDGRIIDLKMVDYQIIRHTSISTDILYLIYGSVRSSLIERSFESLIKIYHNEFLSELRRSRVDEKILAELGTEWLETELRTYSFYGLLVGCFLINPILAEEEDVQQLQTIDFDASSPLYQADINSARNQKKLDRVKCIAFHYYRRFHLGIINDDIEPISVTG